MGRIKVARLAEPEPPRRQLREDLMRVLMTDLTDLFRRGDRDDGDEIVTPPALEDAPVIAVEPEIDTTRLAEDLLRDAVRERATDVHIDPLAEGSRLRLRVDGQVIDTAQLNDLQTRRIVNQIKTLADLDPVRTFSPEDARFTYDLDGRVLDIRVTIVPCVTGQKVAIRLLDPMRVRQSISDLGMSIEGEVKLKEWLHAVSGLFLVTGPTGSGKTTLLYALLHELRKLARSVVTIEDPVEYQIDGITQIQVDTRHELTFAQGIKTMLRLDPDYLMIGEVRDAESARSAIDASIGGRGLMTTLHSRDAVSAISALRNWGASNLEIAVSLSVVVAQRLVRTLCPACRHEAPISDIDKRWLETMGVPAPQTTWQPKGCDACRGLGYIGRTGIFETWRLDESDYDLILAGADERTLRKRLLARGHRFLITDALDKAQAGVTSISELQSIGELVSPGK